MNIDPAVDEPPSVVDGAKITKAQFPDLWQKLIDQGIVNESGEGTPLSALQKVRSQLLKMQRSTADAALRNAIGDEVRSLNQSIEGQLKGTPLLAYWQEANRLWSKGYALRDVADAITAAIKGTPGAQQSSGAICCAYQVSLFALVARLNALADDGILERAFTPLEIKNLRASADILDRIQRTPVGRGQQGMSISHGLRRALSGTPGPLAGTGIGALVGGWHGAEAGCAGLGCGTAWRSAAGEGDDQG